MEFIVGAYSDKGINKSRNQDSFFLRRASIPDGGEILMSVVCDGMGGNEKGELASKTCVEEFALWFDENLIMLPELCRSDFNILHQKWLSILMKVHQLLKQYGEEHKIKLGTTIALFFAYQDKYCIMHVGDTRIYAKHDNLIALTTDHSLLEQQVAIGNLGREQIYHHPQQNILLQCIGIGENIAPSFKQGVLFGNSIYLLCTDGLIHELSEDELSIEINIHTIKTKVDITGALNKMIYLCRERYEIDDITALIIYAKENNIKKASRKWFAKKNLLTETVKLIETADMTHTSESISYVDKRRC